MKEIRDIMQNIIKKALESAFSYNEYRNLVTELLTQKKVTGNEQSEDLVNYTELNETRMNRLDKTIKVPIKINEDFQKLERKYIWLTIAEGWCGDAAQIVPVLHKIAEASDNIDLQLVFRDENDDLMNLFLTNGSKSIPKVIILDAETKEVAGSWGPRPEPARKLIVDYKAEHGVVDETAKVELQKWYLKDKGLSTITELLDLVQETV